MYIFCIIMICIASILLILAVLVQSPKSGMAANFGAANQTMGVRQTTDFLEKFTWAMVAAVVFFSLLSTTANPRVEVKEAAETDYYEDVINDEKEEADEDANTADEIANPELIKTDLKQVNDSEAAGEAADKPVVEPTNEPTNEPVVEPTNE